MCALFCIIPFQNQLCDWWGLRSGFCTNRKHRSVLVHTGKDADLSPTPSSAQLSIGSFFFYSSRDMLQRGFCEIRRLRFGFSFMLFRSTKKKKTHTGTFPWTAMHRWSLYLTEAWDRNSKWTKAPSCFISPWYWNQYNTVSYCNTFTEKYWTSRSPQHTESIATREVGCHCFRIKPYVYVTIYVIRTGIWCVMAFPLYMAHSWCLSDRPSALLCIIFLPLMCLWKSPCEGC